MHALSASEPHPESEAPMFTPPPLPVRTTPLHSRQIFTLRGWKGQRIECVEGHVWVTQDRDLRDIVLGAGEGFTFDRSGPVLVYALGAASFRVESAGAASALSAHPRPPARWATPAAAGCAASY
jgi:hypothetical protein